MPRGGKTEASSETGRSYLGKADTRKRANDPSSVITMLRDFIEAGGYDVGSMLPPERVLAEKFGVGRPAVREGIKALTILDVIESRRGDGTYIKSLDGLRSDWPSTVELRSSNFNLLDLLEVRKMVEPVAARLAAVRASESDLHRIEKECSNIESASDWETMAKHDLALHAAILDAAGNPVLTELNNALARLQRKSREVTGSNATNRTAMVDHHRLIVNAIFRGEGEAAERAMLEHLHHVGLDLISNKKR